MNRITFKRKSGPLLRPRNCQTSYFCENLEEIQEISSKILSDSMQINKNLGPWQRMLYSSEQFKSDINVLTCIPHYESCSKQDEIKHKESQELIDILENEFDHIDNPIINTARNLLMQFSPDYLTLDILLKNTLNWVITQYSGPSSETQMQAMINSLLKFEPDLLFEFGESTCGKSSQNVHEFAPKRNAVLDAAHDYLEKTKLESYIPCMCNTLFKETLKWVLSKYTGPCKYTLEKIMIKMLLKLENELEKNTTNYLQINDIKNHNPIVATANTMLKIMSYSNDSTLMMLNETLNWALNSKNTGDTITTLINLEGDIEHALIYN